MMDSEVPEPRSWSALTQEEIIERSEAVSKAVKRGLRSPPAPRDPPVVADRPRKMIQYYAGRFYDGRDVLDTLAAAFAVVDHHDIFVCAHDAVYESDVRANARVRAFIEQTLRDYTNGSPLPPFVLAAYVQVRKNLPAVV